MERSNNNIVIIPKDWDDIHEYINYTFKYKAYATVLALMVENYTLSKFADMGAYQFSEWKLNYVNNTPDYKGRVDDDS